MGEELREFAGLVIIQPSGGKGYTIYTVEEVLVHRRSRYQDIMVLRIKGFGKALVLDGLIQSTERDEYIYHEALVHPVMISHPSPRRVLILGGGEGATLREVLKHRTVEEVVMVDIDEEVIAVAKEYLPEWHQGAFDDPRVKLVVADGRAYVEEAVAKGEAFDVVIMDLTDPYGPEVARSLYTKDFFSKIRLLVGDEGIMVTQAGSSFFYPGAYERIVASLKEVFKNVVEYGVYVPSFAYVNNFVAASQLLNPALLSAEEVDERLRERGVTTKFYRGPIHVAMMLMGSEPR